MLGCFFNHGVRSRNHEHGKKGHNTNVLGKDKTIDGKKCFGHCGNTIFRTKMMVTTEGIANKAADLSLMFPIR